MELTTGSLSSDDITDIVVKKLLEIGAIGKLATASMDTTETESISLMDEVTACRNQILAATAPFLTIFAGFCWFFFSISFIVTSMMNY